MSDLMNCPFCGGKAKHYSHKNSDGDGWWKFKEDNWISCTECGNQTCMHGSRADAEEAWNSRAAPVVRRYIVTDGDVQAAFVPAESLSERALVTGAFYWVRIVNDPDCRNAWENEDMPARYAGQGKWNYLGMEDESDWPVRWIGKRIEP